MKRHRLTLVDEELLDLLRGIRSKMAGDTNRELVEAVDRMIALMESKMAADNGVSGGELLKLLGQGLAAIPAIQKIIENWRGH